MRDKLQPSPTVVVTGATSGIGRALADILAGAGFSVIGVGRSKARCLSAQRELSREYPSTRIKFLVADLSLQQEVRALARAVEDQLSTWNTQGLDGLVNNAGTFTFWQELTAEGFETQWAVNHLAPFLLTHELLVVLNQASSPRVVTVSSGSHYGTRLNWDDLQLMRRYNPLRAYKQTKLANVLFTVEMDRRLGRDSNIKMLAADPGLVDTDIGAKANSRIARWIWSLRRRNGISTEKSAEGISHLLVAAELESEGQAIYWKHGCPKEPDPHVFDPAAGWRLWEISAQMCGFNPAMEPTL